MLECIFEFRKRTHNSSPPSPAREQETKTPARHSFHASFSSLFSPSLFSRDFPVRPAITRTQHTLDKKNPYYPNNEMNTRFPVDIRIVRDLCHTPTLQFKFIPQILLRSAQESISMPKSRLIPTSAAFYFSKLVS